MITPLLPALIALFQVTQQAPTNGLGQAAGEQIPGPSFSYQIDGDNFNRPTLGGGWFVQGLGNFQLAANRLTSDPINDFILRPGVSMPYKDIITEFDLPANPTALTSTAAITGIGASDQLWTEIQGSNGQYDSIGFFHGNGIGGLPNYGGRVSITPFNGGKVRIYATNNGDTMNVNIDEGNDGTFEYHYESSGILTDLGGALSRGIGFGGNNADADNWNLFEQEFSLSVIGACPGPITLSIFSITPNSNVAILYGNAGSYFVAGGTCSGVLLDVASPTVAGIFTTDNNGDLSLNVTLPAGFCGLTVQAVDIANCAVSRPVVL